MITSLLVVKNQFHNAERFNHIIYEFRIMLKIGRVIVLKGTTIVQYNLVLSGIRVNNICHIVYTMTKTGINRIASCVVIRIKKLSK